MCCASRIKSPALSSSTLLERSRESAAKPTKPMQVTNRQTATAAGTGRMCGTIRAVGTSTRQKGQIGLKRRQMQRRSGSCSAAGDGGGCSSRAPPRVVVTTWQCVCKPRSRRYELLVCFAAGVLLNIAPSSAAFRKAALGSRVTCDPITVF